MATLTAAQAEPLVDAEAAGRHLGLSAQHIRRLVESGRLKGYDYGVGKRRFWRFRLSELDIQVPSSSSSVPRGMENP